jgi:UDP-N-acetylglucosamine--N-acetylmuramyl-(pentapeptide) pyrophosphoryl-undecaprenol N-acetylglucosamine transferase
LAVSRAGASILGELTAFELPAILVPYPYAWRYQQMNARYLERKGAALIVEDARLEIELLSKIRSLIQDPQRLQDMQRCLHSLSQPGAAEKLADLIINLPRARGGAS